MLNVGLHAAACTAGGSKSAFEGDSQPCNAGQLGSTGVDSKRPVEVAGGHQWRQLSAGGLHSCGITIDNGTWCWGSNSAGQLVSGAVKPLLCKSRQCA